MAFEESGEVDEIIPVFRNEDREEGLELIGHYGFGKVKKVAPGGATRQESVFNALTLANRNDCLILIHDGARPLVMADTIKRAVCSLTDCDGSVCAVSVKDTIKEVKDGFVVKTLVRESLSAVQTPQTFRYRTVFEAYSKAFRDGLFFTDDTSVVEHYGGKIKIIDGQYDNIKITTKEDMIYAEAVLSARFSARSTAESSAMSSDESPAGSSLASSAMVVG